MANGAIVYDGPSMIDGKPILAIITGLAGTSHNPKTGKMAQVWILRKDLAPVLASKQSEDSSICGECPLRHSLGGACYVSIFKAPRSVYESYTRGIYPHAENLEEIGRGQVIRLGAYGDPAAVPFEVWESLLKFSAGHTGYTHQWQNCDPRFASILMASCSSVDFELANSRGYRAFIVTRDMEAPRGSLQCPASAERGHKLTCAQCQACSGTKRHGNVYIKPHGIFANRF